MEPRIEYAKVAFGAMTAMLGLETYVHLCGLERSLIELVKVRASQINGCATVWTYIRKMLAPRAKPSNDSTR